MEESPVVKIGVEGAGLAVALVAGCIGLYGCMGLGLTRQLTIATIRHALLITVALCP